MRNKWSSINVCVECGEQMGLLASLIANECCPYCGREGRRTDVDTHSIIYNRTRISPIWRFWNIDYKYKTRDNISEAWINKHVLKTK